MKADEPRQNRIPFMLSDAELSAIDEWRFENRIATRAEAIRRLCQIALLYEPLAKKLQVDARQAAEDTIALSDIVTAQEAAPSERSVVEVPLDLMKRIESNLLWLDVLSIDWQAHDIRSNPDVEAMVKKRLERRRADAPRLRRIKEGKE